MISPRDISPFTPNTLIFLFSTTSGQGIRISWTLKNVFVITNRLISRDYYSLKLLHLKWKLETGLWERRDFHQLTGKSLWFLSSCLSSFYEALNIAGPVILNHHSQFLFLFFIIDLEDRQ